MSQPERSTPEGKPGGAQGGQPYSIRFYIEEPSGDTYRAEALSDTLVRDIAADFFEERGWPTRDQAGRPQRAVVERVNPDDPARSDRLNPNQTLADANVRDEDTLRVLPESVAGLVSPHDRLRALVVDHREVLALAESQEHAGRLVVKTNADHAPTRYELTIRYPGVRLGERGAPERTDEHRAEIVLPADYPLGAPLVRWRTPIFHPNINARGNVCLGVLADRYLPGLGLAYIVRMLIDIARYRNYDLHGVYNLEAAEWALSQEGQRTIKDLGGVPLEEPMDMLLESIRRYERAERPLRSLQRVDRSAQEG